MPCSLNLLTQAASGDRKSTCDRMALEAIREIESKEMIEHAEKARGVRDCVPGAPRRLFAEPTCEYISTHFVTGGYASIGLFSDEGDGFLGGYSMKSETRQAAVSGLTSIWGNTPCKQTGLKVEFSTKEEESSAMKQSRFTDSQIMAILKQVENGLAVPDVCREHGISVPTFYKWRAKFGGMDASLIARMKELEAENARLKKMYIETQIKNDLLSEALGKKP